MKLRTKIIIPAAILAAVLAVSAIVVFGSGNVWISGATIVTFSKDGVLTVRGIGAMKNYDRGAPPWFGIQDSITGLFIKNGVTRIGNRAFAIKENRQSIRSITIPRSVTTIGEQVFVGFGDLTSINVDDGNPRYRSVDGVLFIGDLFLIQYPRGRQGAYTIPDGALAIFSEAFVASSGLTSVTIPESVESIGHGAFFHCSGLSSVTVLSPHPPQIRGDSAFSDLPVEACLYVLESAVDKYHAAEGWDVFKCVEPIAPTEEKGGQAPI